jgi:hypothetical protein
MYPKADTKMNTEPNEMVVVGAPIDFNPKAARLPKGLQ